MTPVLPTNSTKLPPAKAPDLPEVTVYLHDGQRITGLLVGADAKQLVVRIGGIDTRLALDTVERYDVLPPVLERYNELRQSIGNEPDDIVRLALWLQTREQYSLALTEVQRALETDKSHAEALRLEAVLKQQIILRARRAAPPSPLAAPKRDAVAAGEGQDAAPNGNDRGRRIDFPLLAPEEINLIKVFETDLSLNPRLVIPRDAVLRMLDANSGHPLVPLTREGREAIVRKPPAEVLDLMFKLQAREFYSKVEVLDTPPAIKAFRQNVATTWLMSCATSQCHGGLEAGRLVLSNRAPNSDASVYTNLLVLDRFRTTLSPMRNRPGSRGRAPAPAVQAGRGAEAGVRAVALIDWDNPERSPLLQAGLPRADSLFSHPVVLRPGQPGGSGGGSGGGGDQWKPQFQSTEDKLFQRAVEWLRAMYRPRPDYPVEYRPLRPFEPETPNSPGAAPAAEPARR